MNVWSSVRFDEYKCEVTEPSDKKWKEPGSCGLCMNEKSILFLRRLPYRLGVNQAAELLDFLPHAIPFLVKAGLLKPLGKPASNGHKFFSSEEISVLSQYLEWLDKATRAVAKHWKEKNLAPDFSARVNIGIYYL